METRNIKIVDGWINLNPAGKWDRPGLGVLLRDKESQSRPAAAHLYPGLVERMTKGATTEEIIALMDESGVQKAVLHFWPNLLKEGLEAIEKYPDRFVGRLGVDPHGGMESIRLLESTVKGHGVKAATVAYFAQRPYNDKVFYPVYAKCIELGIPIVVTVGIPGTRVPGEHQDPIHLDEVCWFFPELKIIMSHGGEPWQYTCVRMMMKWPNLYYMTSGYLPKYIPQEIVHYMNTRGAEKILFASDYPILTFERAVGGLNELQLKDNVWPRFLRENAVTVYNI